MPSELPSKIVQIMTPTTESGEFALIVLCEDGSLWSAYPSTGNPWEGWHEIKPRASTEEEKSAQAMRRAEANRWRDPFVTEVRIV